jgi:hypothetical protein
MSRGLGDEQAQRYRHKTLPVYGGTQAEAGQMLELRAFKGRATVYDDIASF